MSIKATEKLEDEASQSIWQIPKNLFQVLYIYFL